MTTAMSARAPTAGSRNDVPAGAGIPHRRLILSAIVVVLLGAVAMWLIGFTSVFGVRTVTVQGEVRLSADQVRTAANITHGAPLARLDVDAIRHRVEGMPDVASATVGRSFPSTVVITVVERVAIGVVEVDDGYQLVDRTGKQFRLAESRPAQLPLFVVPRGTAAQPTASAVATVAQALPQSLRSRVTSIQALDPNGIQLLMAHGRVVRWGSPARSADKARVLTALLRQPGKQFDVTDPGQPFTR